MTKRIAIITIIAIALIVLGGAVAYITLKQGGEEVEREQPVVTVPEPPKEPVVRPEQPTTPEPIDTSDWKVYIPSQDPSTIRLVRPPKDPVILSLEDLPKIAPEMPPPLQHLSSIAFTDAALNSNGNVLAFSVRGARHDWIGIYELTTQKISPISIVDHGAVENLSWIPGKLVLIAETVPARGTRTLEVIDLESKEHILLWDKYFEGGIVETYDPHWDEEDNVLEFTVHFLKNKKISRWVFNLDTKEVHPKD
jgi:hypothetical protein